MRKIRLLCVGKNQNNYIKQGISEFEKKLQRYCNFIMQPVKEANYRTGTRTQWLDKEYSRLHKYIGRNNWTIVCDESGISLTSAEFSNQFINWSNKGFSQFDFFIGGAYGLSDQIKKSADFVLSLSPMTMTHQMFRLMLTEQIYRAFTIINGEKYHHI